MADLSTTAADLAGTAITNVAAYLSLHTAAPGTSGGSEVSGGSYARQAITWNSWSGGSVSSSDGQTFSGMPSESGNLYIGLWSASSSGTYYWGSSASAVTGPIPSGGTVTFASGAVTGTVS
jgi:hypothetical protein